MLVRDEPCKTWNEFIKIATSDFKGKWYFRGVRDDWNLETSLERNCKNWDLSLSKLPRIESILTREFKRSFPRWGEFGPPDPADTIGWLALMQHYGAPTRLLDWTYSPFIAAYFALCVLLSSEDKDKVRKAVVWALSVKPFERIPDFLPSEVRGDFDHYARHRDGPSFESVFMKEPPIPFVNPVNPVHLNERLVTQQGVFLCPGDVSRSFEDNLMAVPDALDPHNIRKLSIPREIMKEAFDSLHRMNINEASLFPGTDGYARQFRVRMNFFSGTEIYEGTVA